MWTSHQLLKNVNRPNTGVDDRYFVSDHILYAYWHNLFGWFGFVSAANATFLCHKTEKTTNNNIPDTHIASLQLRCHPSKKCRTFSVVVLFFSDFSLIFCFQCWPSRLWNSIARYVHLDFIDRKMTIRIEMYAIRTFRWICHANQMRWNIPLQLRANIARHGRVCVYSIYSAVMTRFEEKRRPIIQTMVYFLLVHIFWFRRFKQNSNRYRHRRREKNKHS